MRRPGPDRADAAASFFASREIAGLVTQVAQALLTVQGHRVIDFAADLLAFEMAHEGVTLTLRHAHDVLIEYVPPVRAHCRPLQEVAELVFVDQCVVALRCSLAAWAISMSDAMIVSLVC